MAIHSPSMVPNLLEFSGAESEISQERRFVCEFARKGDANRRSEKSSPGWHEVSLPITERPDRSSGAQRYVQTLALTPQLRQRVCEGRPRDPRSIRCIVDVPGP